MNQYFPLLVALAARENRTGLAEAALISSSAIPAAPRMLLAVEREREHSRQVESVNRLRDEEAESTAQELGALLREIQVPLKAEALRRFPRIEALLARLPEDERRTIVPPGDGAGVRVQLAETAKK